MCVRFAAVRAALLSASVDGTVREWDLAYYERDIAVQVDARLRVLGIEPGDSREAAWRNWAQTAIRGASQRDAARLQFAATRAGSEGE